MKSGPLCCIANCSRGHFVGHPCVFFGLFMELQVKLGIETSGVCFGLSLAWTLKSGSWSWSSSWRKGLVYITEKASSEQQGTVSLTAAP